MELVTPFIFMWLSVICIKWPKDRRKTNLLTVSYRSVNHNNMSEAQFDIRRTGNGKDNMCCVCMCMCACVCVCLWVGRSGLWLGVIAGGEIFAGGNDLRQWSL